MSLKNCQVLLLSLSSISEKIFSYLSGRGIDLHVHFDRRSLLQQVLHQKPTTVFLSVGFPDALLTELEDILVSQSCTRIVYFSENDSVADSARLSNQKSKNKIFGSLSGPAIERAVISLTGDPLFLTKATSDQPEAGATKMRMNRAFTMIQRRSHDVLDGQAKYRGLKLQTVQQFHCYRVYSEGLTHTFILATTESLESCQGEIKQLAQIIRQSMEDQGFHIQDESLFLTEARDFSLKEWFHKQKLSFFSTFSKGEEWAIGFFVDSKSHDLLRDQQDSQMYTIPTELFASGQAVDFDLYVYFKNTGRYALIVPRKSRLTPGTFQSLQKHGVESLHVVRDDRHRARKYLFEKKIRSTQMNSGASASVFL